MHLNMAIITSVKWMIQMYDSQFDLRSFTHLVKHILFTNFSMTLKLIIQCVDSKITKMWH